MRKPLAIAVLAVSACSAGLAQAPSGIPIPIAGGGTTVTCAKTLTNGVKVPCQLRVGADGLEKGTSANPDAMTPVLLAAASTPIEADITATGSSSGSFSGGTAIVGPFVAQLGRDLRVIIRPTTAGSPFTGKIWVGTSAHADACAPGTVSSLTIGGVQWGSFTSPANEVVDTPTLNGVDYCVSAAIVIGSAHVTIRQ